MVVDSDTYVTEIEKEMDGCESYAQSGGNGQQDAVKAVKKVANILYREGHICQELKNYLIPKHPAQARLKGNPKVHKEGHPFRTIVNGIGTATENMAGVAERELNEFVEGTPSYIWDTSDFLNKLQGIPQPLPDGVILFCFDVVKLYPSIPRLKGLRACEQALRQRTNHSIPTEAALDMIETVLDNNIISFNSKEYRQTKGVAIGSKLGRNFTDKHMYIDYKSNHPTSVKKAIPYSLGLRLKQICTKDSDYWFHRWQLKKQLRKRGYDGKFLDKQLARVDNIKREDLLQGTNHTRNKAARVPLLLTVSSHLPDIHNIIKKNLPELQKSDHMKEVFQQIPMVAYRRGRNLGDTRVHRKTNKVMRGTPNSQKSCQKNCVV